MKNLILSLLVLGSFSALAQTVTTDHLKLEIQQLSPNSGDVFRVSQDDIQKWETAIVKSKLPSSDTLTALNLFHHYVRIDQGLYLNEYDLNNGASGNPRTKITAEEVKRFYHFVWANKELSPERKGEMIQAMKTSILREENLITKNNCQCIKSEDEKKVICEDGTEYLLSDSVNIIQRDMKKIIQESSTPSESTKKPLNSTNKN